MPATATRNGFKATRKKGGGHLTVHRVPIFVETKKLVQKGDADELMQFDAGWIGKAVARAQRQEAEGYFAPLHVQHHGGRKEVVAAGHIKVLGTEVIQFNGEPRTAVMADLVVTNPAVEADIRAGRFPYRSVEIHKPSLTDDPGIDSLALLDDEVPHCRLPNLEVGEVAEAEFSAAGVAAFRASDGFAVCFDFDTEQKKPKAKRDAEAGGDPDDNAEPGEGKEGEEGAEASTPTAKAIVEAIDSGEITVADLQAIVEAIKRRSASAGGEGQGGEAPKSAGPARAPSPQQMAANNEGGTHMTEKKKEEVAPEVTGKADAENAVQMAALRSEIDILKASNAQREASEKRNVDVAGAMKRLAGRPLGADLEANLTKFHADFGAAAFAEHVTRLERAVGVTPTGAAAGSVNMGTDKVPDVAMKYSAQGPEAVARAAKFAAQHAELRARGITRLTAERFIELRMEPNVLADAG